MAYGTSSYCTLLPFFYLAKLTTTRHFLEPYPLNTYKMAKYKYISEYEINASLNMLYPQLSTAVGLKAWFAEDVKVHDEKQLDIVWDGVNHPAKIVSWRTNHHIKYRFAPMEEGGESSTLEFRLEHSDMTQTTFLKVIDYSDMDSDEDLDELWDGLVHSLKESLGDTSQ